MFDEKLYEDEKSIFKDVAIMIEGAAPCIKIQWFEALGIKISEKKYT